MFRFSLEPVLDVRRRSEEAAQRSMAEAMRRLAEVDQRLQAMRQMLEQVAMQRLEICSKGYQPALLQLYGHYILDLKEKIVAQEQLLRKAAEEVEQQRQRLMEAAQKKKVMEELKKVEYEESVRLELQEERKRNDDIAIFAYGRRETQGE